MGEFEQDEPLLRHPFWREWIAGAYYHPLVRGLDGDGTEHSFIVTHELPERPPRFRAPLALPPPLTGELTVTLAAPVRKREGLACTHLTVHMDPDSSKLRSLMMSQPPLEFRAQVWNAGLPVLDVTWEGSELIYSAEDHVLGQILAVPHPPAPGSGYQDGIRIRLGDPRQATVLLERPPASSTGEEADSCQPPGRPSCPSSPPGETPRSPMGCGRCCPCATCTRAATVSGWNRMAPCGCISHLARRSGVP